MIESVGLWGVSTAHGTEARVLQIATLRAATLQLRLEAQVKEAPLHGLMLVE